MSKYDKLQYPVHSDVPQGKAADQDVQKAFRMGHARCVQWMNSSNISIPGIALERPKNPFIESGRLDLQDAYEDGWSTAMSNSVKGRGF